MKLIKVEVEGFKSFATKTTLTFNGGIVGIVGPNGSGKSNISDAIKWVLGETSIKSLRGDSMEDVIFAGSKTQKATNKARVSLTFDNSDQKVSIPHKEFTITRILRRGKSSNEYYINDEVARLRDIKEIAMESGMSKSSLAIISQGTIADIAQATPEQRRGIFEEVAGISKYKSRKKEAMRKLDKTTEGLERIKMIIQELEKQLRPLKRQAEKAKIFLEKRDKLKNIEIGLIIEDVAFFDEALKRLNVELEEVINSKDDLNKRIERTEKELQEKNNQKNKLENEIVNLANEFQSITEKLQLLEIKDSESSQRRKLIIQGKVKSSSEQRLKEIKNELKEMYAKLQTYNKLTKKTEESLEEKITSISELKSSLSKLKLNIDQKKNNLYQTKARISILKDYKENKSNLFKGVKTVLENIETFPGTFGMVADLLTIKPEYKKAIEVILKNSLQNIVVKDPDVAVKLINFLKNNNAGRATFIPMSVIHPKSIHSNHLLVIEAQNGFIDIASNLVKVSPKFEILKKFLLGNIIVANDIESAEKISTLVEKRYAVATLQGDIIKVGGLMTGGSALQSRSIIGIDDEINKLEKLIPERENAVEEMLAKQESLMSTLNQENDLVSQLNIEAARIFEQKSLLNSQYIDLKNRYEEESKEKFEEEKITDIGNDLEVLSSEKTVLQTKLKAKRNSVIELNNDISRTTMLKADLEKILRDITESSAEKLAERDKAKFIVETSKKRLSEGYEMTIETARKSFSLKIEREKARKIVSTLRNEIKSLGNINLDSIKDFEEIDKRHKKLKETEEELFSAQQTILSAIDEMDQIIVTKLDETVKQVDKEMDSIFRTMFGGGHAELKYTDPNNLLETGIEVKAQPPGKTIKNLKLFSGGEKALVAITLLFAILKSKPLPLAILDEVEASLDEANVIRYAYFLQKLKKNTQFIVITHRVGTMAKIDYLFGATMQQNGITSFFSVELAKAKKLIENETFEAEPI